MLQNQATWLCIILCQILYYYVIQYYSLVDSDKFLEMCRKLWCESFEIAWTVFNASSFALRVISVELVLYGWTIISRDAIWREFRNNGGYRGIKRINYFLKIIVLIFNLVNNYFKWINCLLNCNFRLTDWKLIIWNVGKWILLCCTVGVEWINVIWLSKL